MAYEQFFELPNNQYGEGFVIQKYHGDFYVQSAQRGQDGNIYKKWMSVYKRKGEFVTKDTGEPHVFPVGVKISETAANAIIESCVSSTPMDEDSPY